MPRSHPAGRTRRALTESQARRALIRPYKRGRAHRTAKGLSNGMATRSSPICFWRSPPARTRARPASTTGARRRTGSRCRRRPGLQEQENGPRQQVSGVPFWLMPPSPGARRIRLPERARPMALLCRSRPPFAIHEGPPRRVSVLENPRSGGCPTALMASCRRQARAAAAGWARRIAGAISVAWPPSTAPTRRVLAERPTRAASQRADCRNRQCDKCVEPRCKA